MSTDEDKSISVCADKQLQDIEKKYPGFIHMKAQNGIKLSFTLQTIIQGTTVARGFREKEGELPAALNGFLYSILRSKQQRRALVLSILKQFDEHVVCFGISVIRGIRLKKKCEKKNYGFLVLNNFR